MLSRKIQINLSTENMYTPNSLDMSVQKCVPSTEFNVFRYVVEPTHLKDMLVKLGMVSPNRQGK